MTVVKERVNGFFGITVLPPAAQRLVQKLVLFNVLSSFLFFLSNTFFILFVEERIGFAGAGVMIALSMFVQLVTDYPSGALSDRIGARWVSTLSFVSFSAYFVLLSIADTLEFFLFLAIIQGFANGQSSGTVGSWFDSNYKLLAEDKDPGRKIYGMFQGKQVVMFRGTLVFSFILGSSLATVVSREFVFLIQGVTSLVLIFASLWLMKDEEGAKKVKSDAKYFAILKEGLRHFVSDKQLFFFYMGSAVTASAFMIWGNLLLVPIYFGYTGTDSLTGLLRSFIFVLTLPVGIKVANLSRKVANERLPLIRLLEGLIFFPSYFVLTTLVPPTNTFNPLGMTVVVFLMVLIVPAFADLSNLIAGRVGMEIVPSEIRNSIYSLLPSIIAILGIPVLIIAGFMIEAVGLPGGILMALATHLTGSFLIFVSFRVVRNKSVTEEEINAGVLPTNTVPAP